MKYKKVKLKDIASINMGQSPKGNSYNNQNIGMEFLQGNRTFGRIYPSIDTWTTQPNKIGKKNSILMSVRAPVGDLNIANRDICIGRGLCSIDMKNGNNQYLYYLLMNSMQEIKIKSTGTIFDSINRKELEEIEVLNFNEEQQKKISKILYDIDKKIELNIEINNNLNSFIENYYKKKFIYNTNSKLKKMCELVDTTIGGDWGKEKLAGNYNSEVICIRGTDIPQMNNGNKGKAPNRFILEKNLKLKKLQGEEIVIEISGGSPNQSTGRCVYITKELEKTFDKPLICTNFCRAIRLKDTKFLPSFYMKLKYLYSKNIMFLYENGTTGIKNLDLTSLIENEDINIINKNEMLEFNELFYKINKEVIKYSEENRTLEKLRDTLLPKLMKGEINLNKI